jgi:hypothetical protein
MNLLFRECGSALRSSLESFVITGTLESWTALVPASQSVPLGTQCVLLTLELMLFAVAVQAIWWTVRSRLRTRGNTHAHRS